MQEIANNVFIETEFPGVVLAAIKLQERIIMIDAPFRREDQRAWQLQLSSFGGGVSRLLVMLDTHIDRTWGVSAMESVVISHANAVNILEERPASCRGQDIDPGAECEVYDLPGNVNWPEPDMTYTQSLLIHWDDQHIVLTHRSGAHSAATWLRYDAEKILFVGDSVMVNQPPFLQKANLEIWIRELEELLSDSYNGYRIVSSRNGVVRKRAIEKWMRYLMTIKAVVDEIAEGNGEVVDLIEQTPNLLKKLNIDHDYAQLYNRRLTWGLETYYQQHTSDK